MKKILCPTDFTNCAENAVAYAQELAGKTGASLVLFHSVSLPSGVALYPVGGVPFMEAIPDPEEKLERKKRITEAKEKLEAAAQKIKNSEVLLANGSILDTIPEAAHKQKADLVVMGHAGLQDFFEGSVTSNIIRESPCPVLVVPPHVSFTSLRKIIYATDLRTDTFTEISFILQLAGQVGAEVIFSHVLIEDTEATRAKAECELQVICERSNFPSVSYKLVANQNIEEGLIQLCFREQADLLVMGSRNKNFSQRLLLQDNAQEVAAQTFIPLLVLPYKR